MRGDVSFAALLFTLPQAEAAPALSTLFTDRMVLQRDQQVPVWGSAATYKVITVTFADQSKTVGVDANGRWLVRLDPIPASLPVAARQQSPQADLGLRLTAHQRRSIPGDLAELMKRSGRDVRHWVLIDPQQVGQ